MHPGDKRPFSSGFHPLIETYVAGFPYHEGPGVLRALRRHQRLALQREPLNPHDPLTVAVHTRDGRKLGYVPRTVNLSVALRLDRGAMLETRVAAVGGDEWPEVAIRIGVAPPFDEPLPEERDREAREAREAQAKAEAQRRERVRANEDMARHSLDAAESAASNDAAGALRSAFHSVLIAMEAWLWRETELTAPAGFEGAFSCFVQNAPAALVTPITRWWTIAAELDQGNTPWAEGRPPPWRNHLDAVRMVVWEARGIVNRLCPPRTETLRPLAATWPAERRNRKLWALARLSDIANRCAAGERLAVTRLRVLREFNDDPGAIIEVVRNEFDAMARVLPRTPDEIAKDREIDALWPEPFRRAVDPVERNPLIDRAVAIANGWPQTREAIPELVLQLGELQSRTLRRGRLRRRRVVDDALYRIELSLVELERPAPDLYRVARVYAVASRSLRRLDRLLPHWLVRLGSVLSQRYFGMDFTTLWTCFPAFVRGGLELAFAIRPGDATDEELGIARACWFNAWRTGTFRVSGPVTWEQVLTVRSHLSWVLFSARGRAARNIASRLAEADLAFLAATEARARPISGHNGVVEWWYARDPRPGVLPGFQ